MIDEAKIIDVLKTIYDPEIPVNIYDLGLIYTIRIDDQSYVDIGMTLTSPNCPVAESLPIEVRNKINTLEGVEHVKVEILWEPPWNPDMMSEAAKLELGFL
ncbi:MAG: SUF system Fe-S cluster assembly protein [Calditrichaceae bacterium]|nr:SUF system Fe-S cluster assembly protein [Calditrichaceae bacterium]